MALASLVGVGIASFRETDNLASADQWEKHTYQVLLELERFLSAMTDAETGQRGYLITGKEDYLAPYEGARSEIRQHLDAVTRLTTDNPSQQKRLAEIASLSSARLEWLEQAIALRRMQGYTAARDLVFGGTGKSLMDSIRMQVAAAEAEEQRLLNERTERKLAEIGRTRRFFSLIGIGSLGALVAVFLLLQHEIASRRRIAGELEQYRNHLEELVQARTEALRQNRELLRLITDSAPALIAYMDSDYRYRMVNRTLLHWFDLPPERIVGQPVHEIVGEEAWEKVRPWVARALAGEAVNFEHEVQYRDGGARWVMATYTPDRAPSGRVRGIVVLVTDISARIAAEKALEASRERFAGIVESAMDAIITVDAEQRIVLFNVAAETMFRCSGAEVLGTSLERFIPARFRASHAQHIRQFGQTGATNRAMGRLGELYGLRADGEQFPIEASISQIEVQGEKLYTVILRDISARVAAEEEIRRMSAELEARVEARTAELQEANQELESFAYAVSHDLRAPVRAISGFTRMLADDYGDRLDETGYRYLDNVADAARRMGELIDGLLQLSRSTRGDFMRARIDLSALAEKILSEISSVDPGRTVRCDIEPGLEAEGDPRMLQALMRNLLDNAWKYTTKTADARIRLYTDRSDGRIRYCIADNGAGFDMAHADRLFQPFRRLHSQGEFAGIGIGLATVQRIVRRHGGEIRVEAKPGEGACFCFTLTPQSETGQPKPI